MSVSEPLRRFFDRPYHDTSYSGVNGRTLERIARRSEKRTPESSAAPIARTIDGERRRTAGPSFAGDPDGDTLDADERPG